MSLLSRFKILTKILAVIGLLSAVAIFITVLGVTSLKHLDEAAQRMELVSDEALLGQRLSVSLLSMNRAEFQLVADPRPANRAAMREAVNAEAKLFRERLQALAGKAKHPELKAQIAGIEQAWALYQRDLEETFRAANAVTNFQSNEQLDVLRKDAQASAEVADKLRGSLRTLSDGLEKDLHKIATEADEEYKSISLVMEVAAGAGILLGLLFGFLIGQYGVARPIRGAVELLKKLANGDYNVDVSGAERKDEVGDVARTAIVFKENGLAKLRMEQEQKESEARVAAQRKADMRELAHQFESAVGTIIETVSSASSQLEAAAGTLSETAATTQQLSGAVATASEQASANVQSVATATEELSSSVDEIGRRVQDSSRIAANAVQQAERTDAKINELSQAAARIGDVVKLITAIAEQTNLLALNATIEAARAGEAGRGFAVVASEVKSLANQTAKATEEISTQIAGMQQATTQSVTAIKEIGATIEQVAQIASAIAAAVEEQGAATMEISRNVQQAAQGTTLVASNIADVNRGASGTGSASAQVLASAKSLSTESHNLKQAVGSFLATVRAA